MAVELTVGRRVTRLSRQAARNLRDPAVQGRWFTYVQGVSNQTEVLVEQTSVPWHKTQPISRPVGGTFRHYPGAHDIDGLQIVFYETWDYRVTKWLNEWREQVYNPETGVFGRPSDYRRQFVTEFFPPHNEDPTIRRYYNDCWPVEQQPFEMTYAEIEGRVTVSGLFAVNRVQTAFLTPRADQFAAPEQPLP